MSRIKVRKRAKIRYRYNQAPHLPQDTNGKVTTSQLDITNESQEVSPLPAGDHKASINRRTRRHQKKHDRNNIYDPQRKHRLKPYHASLFAHSRRLLITFANQVDPDQAQQNAGSDLD